MTLNKTTKSPKIDFKTCAISNLYNPKCNAMHKYNIALEIFLYISVTSYYDDSPKNRWKTFNRNRLKAEAIIMITLIIQKNPPLNKTCPQIQPYYGPNFTKQILELVNHIHVSILAKGGNKSPCSRSPSSYFTNLWKIVKWWLQL